MKILYFLLAILYFQQIIANESDSDFNKGIPKGNELDSQFEPNNVNYSPLRPDNFELGYEGEEEGNLLKRQLAITHHGGNVMRANPINCYVIWYGNWVNSTYNYEFYKLVTVFLSHIGNTPWFNINKAYTDKVGSVSGGVRFVRSTGFGKSTYTYGSVLSGQEVYFLVRSSITSGIFPLDENGVYFVLSSADVAQYDSDSSYGFCTAGNGYCGWHSYYRITHNYITKPIKYSWVGNPEKCNMCHAQKVSPNGNWAADAMMSIVAHELAEAATDPEFNAWFDSSNAENADKCAWTFGSLSYGTNSIGQTYKYNMQFANRKWLIQRNWKTTGGCSVS